MLLLKTWCCTQYLLLITVYLISTVEQKHKDVFKKSFKYFFFVYQDKVLEGVFYINKVLQALTCSISLLPFYIIDGIIFHYAFSYTS